MSKQMTRTVVAAFLAIGICGVAFGDDGPEQCSAETLHGRYVFSASGFTAIGGVMVPKAIVEVIDFNGDLSLAVPAATRSVNGTIVRSSPGVYSYTIAQDCTGTITFEGPTFDIFVSPAGNQLWMIQTNTGNVFAGSATRVSGEGDERGRDRR